MSRHFFPFQICCPLPPLDHIFFPTDVKPGEEGEYDYTNTDPQFGPPGFEEGFPPPGGDYEYVSYCYFELGGRTIQYSNVSPIVAAHLVTADSPSQGYGAPTYPPTLSNTAVLTKKRSFEYCLHLYRTTNLTARTSPSTRQNPRTGATRSTALSAWSLISAATRVSNEDGIFNNNRVIFIPRFSVFVVA